jgi:hypothetical protein
MNIFKLNSGVTENAQTVVGQTNYTNHYTEVNANQNWQELKVIIRQAVDIYIKPFIGSPIYDDLVTKVNTGIVLTPTQTEFLTALCDAVAYYSQVHGISEKISVMANAGNVTNNPSTSPATSLPSLKFKLHNLTLKADKFLDMALAILETAVAGGNAYFDLWKNAHAYNAVKADLFRQTADFQKHQNILDSRRTFVALIPKMADAALRFIKPTLGEEMYTELVTQFNAKSLSNPNLLLLPYAQRATAAHTKMLACDDNRLILESDGFKIISNTEGANQSATVLEDRNNSIGIMRNSAALQADFYLKELRTFLYKNATNYPTFKNSDTYVTNGQTRQSVFNSTVKGGVFIKKS